MLIACFVKYLVQCKFCQSSVFTEAKTIFQVKFVHVYEINSLLSLCVV